MSDKSKTLYYSDPAARKEIDTLLELNAGLRASIGTDSTDMEVLDVEAKINVLMAKIKIIDPVFHDTINVN